MLEVKPEHYSGHSIHTRITDAPEEPVGAHTSGGSGPVPLRDVGDIGPVLWLLCGARLVQCAESSVLEDLVELRPGHPYVLGGFSERHLIQNALSEVVA